MVLKEFEFLNKNNRIIIVGAMVLGVLYPFFSDADLPINPKYILIGASILAIVLFWEVHGEKKYQEQPQSTRQQIQQAMPYQQPYQQFQQPYNPYPQQPYPPYPPQPQYGNPQIPAEAQPYTQYPQQRQQQPPPERPTEFDMFSDYTKEPVERSKLPRVSDVIKGKARLPERIPPPKEIPMKKGPKSSFEKFGL